MGDLSRNFSRREFVCKGAGCCGGCAPVASELVAALQALRDLIGMPLRVSSGFRCLTHNRRVGSADTSQHPLGRAADIIPPIGMMPAQLAALAEKVNAFHAGGIGIYGTFVHLDVRRDGPAKWVG